MCSHINCSFGSSRKQLMVWLVNRKSRLTFLLIYIYSVYTTYLLL